MKRHILPLMAILCLLFSSVHAQTSSSANISAHLIPLKSMTPGDGFEDMMPMKSSMAQARILGAGEGTHGTHEFFTFKHRLFRFLVQEMGYTVFAIEDGIYGAALIQWYITTGEGNPREILKEEFHDVFQVQELLDLIEWMRGYNAAHGNKLTFTGFDSQQLDAYVRGIRETTGRYGFEGFRVLTEYTAPENDPAFRAYLETRHITDSIVKHMPARPDNFPEKEWEQTTWYLLNIQAGLHQFTAKDWLPAINTRDSMMAQNVQRIAAQHPGEKIMLWAHNGHVGSRHGAIGKEFTTLGAHLKKHFGGDYQNLGFSTGSGFYRARSEKDNIMRAGHSLSAPVKGSIELRLHETGMPAFCFLTRKFPLEGRFRMIGSISATQQFVLKPLKIADVFDWLVYADKTTAAQGL